VSGGDFLSRSEAALCTRRRIDDRIAVVRDLQRVVAAKSMIGASDQLGLELGVIDRIIARKQAISSALLVQLYGPAGAKLLPGLAPVSRADADVARIMAIAGARPATVVAKPVVAAVAKPVVAKPAVAAVAKPVPDLAEARELVAILKRAQKVCGGARAAAKALDMGFSTFGFLCSGKRDFTAKSAASVRAWAAANLDAAGAAIAPATGGDVTPPVAGGGAIPPVAGGEEAPPATTDDAAAAIDALDFVPDVAGEVAPVAAAEKVSAPVPDDEGPGVERAGVAEQLSPAKAVPSASAGSSGGSAADGRVNTVWADSAKTVAAPPPRTCPSPAWAPPPVVGMPFDGRVSTVYADSVKTVAALCSPVAADLIARARLSLEDELAGLKRDRAAQMALAAAIEQRLCAVAAAIAALAVL
jgi:hypothetical protein